MEEIVKLRQGEDITVFQSGRKFYSYFRGGHSTVHQSGGRLYSYVGVEMLQFISMGRNSKFNLGCTLYSSSVREENLICSGRHFTIYQSGRTFYSYVWVET